MSFLLGYAFLDAMSSKAYLNKMLLFPIVWGYFPGIIPFRYLLIGGFNKSGSRKQSRKGLLALLGVGKREGGNATDIGNRIVVLLGGCLHLGTIDLYRVCIIEAQADDGAIMDIATAEMDKGQLGLCHIIPHHIIDWLIGVLRHRLDMEHYGMLIGHGVQMKQLADTTMYLVFGNDLLAVNSLLGTAGLFLGGEDIAVAHPFKGEHQREYSILCCHKRSD